MIKVRITNHVNYTEFVDVEVKNEEDIDKLYDNLDKVEWTHGKDYGSTTHEILEEEKKWKDM